MNEQADSMTLPELYELMGYRRHHTEPLDIMAPPVDSKYGSEAPLSFPLTDKCELRTLRWHNDARGSLAELHRISWTAGKDLPPERRRERRYRGNVHQVYVSTTRPGIVKGWHVHAQQTDRFVCVRGAVLVALCDLRGLLSHRGMAMRVKTYVLDSSRGMSQLTIPPGVAHGWRALDSSDGESWVMNLCSHEYDGTDEWRKSPRCSPADGVYFDWFARVDG